MDRINNIVIIVIAVFYTWLAAMIVTELHLHHGTTHTGTQPVWAVRR